MEFKVDIEIVLAPVFITSVINLSLPLYFFTNASDLNY